MKLREALQKALVIFDWLERRTIYQDAQVKDAHNAVRAALAEPVELSSTTVDYPLLPEPTVYTQEAEIRFAIANRGRAGSFYAAPDKATDIELFTEDRMRAYVDADRAQRVPLPDRLIRFTLRDLKAKREALNGFVALGNERERAREYDQWILSLERYIETAQDGGAND